jgi:hypothetical protein
VDWALDRCVDAVALAGDVVDGEDDFFEGYRLLERGVARLADAGVQVVGVAGNHDVKVLPRLSQHISAFRLLGEGGAWESCTLEAEGESITLWGWSFPQRTVASSPVGDRPQERGPGVNLGLLHCDLDVATSAYAPVTRGELEVAGLDGWLLGHIHVPSPLGLEQRIGYLGSVTGLHPGETGPHGPWLLRVEGGQLVELQQQPLAPLRWEHLDVDLEEIPDVEHVKDALLGAVRRLDATLSGASQGPSAVGLRVRFVGRSSLGSQLATILSEDERAHIFGHGGERHYFVDDVRVDVRPVIPLERLARELDPPGLLARRLLLLDADPSNADRRRLLEEARAELRGAVRREHWRRLEDDGLDDAEVVDLVRQAGMRMLDALLAQRPTEEYAA